MKNYIVSVMAASMMILVSGHNAYATVVVHFNPGTTFVTPKILDDFTLGSEMYGMDVTAFFKNGSSETVKWDDTGALSGGASGTNWGISLYNSSYTNPWKVAWSNVDLVGLLFDAKTGRAAFDLTWPIATSTPATYSGVTFKATDNPYNLNFLATYSNLIAVGDIPPAGDLYRNLLVSWDGTSLGDSGSFEFMADTDSIKKPVPEPATLLLFGTGLVALMRVGRTTRKKCN